MYSAEKYSRLRQGFFTCHLSGNIQDDLHEGQWVDSVKKDKKQWISSWINKHHVNTELADEYITLSASAISSSPVFKVTEEVFIELWEENTNCQITKLKCLLFISLETNSLI